MKWLSVVVSLILIVGASSWALFHPSFFRVHDYVHAARISEMTTALEEGHFPVRWTRNFGYGYGMPLFEFYAPLPFYFGSLLYWLGLPIIPTVKAVFLLSSVLTAIGAYKLGSMLFDRMSGVLTAAAITLAPYRAVNLFVRGAIGEAWGIMAMPWILVGIIKVIRGQKHGWLILVVSLVTLMLSHNIMTMMFVPLSVLFGALYLAFYYLKNKKENPFIKVVTLAGSYLLAVGMSAFYMFPALAENKFTQVHKILGGYFDYTQHFLYIRQFFFDRWGYDGSEWGPDDKISFFLGWGQLIGLALTIGLLVYRVIWLLKQKQSVKKIISDKLVVLPVIVGLLVGLSLFMTLFKSLAVWQAISPLSVAQFPWRFMGPGIVFVGLLMGASAALIPKTKHQLTWLGICLALLVTNGRYFQPREFLDNPDDFYYTDPDRIQRQMSSILPDYIYIDQAESLKIPQSRVTCGDFEHSLDETCNNHVEVLVDRGHQVLIRTNFIEDMSQVNVAIANFPGWKSELDGQPVPTAVSEWGTVALMAPKGEHLLGVYFGSTPVRFWSDTASLISVLILLFLLLPIKSVPARLKKHD